MTSNEHRIRELAYQIWQSEGCPEGQHDRHWQMACKLVESESQDSVPPRTRKPAATRKASPAAKRVEVAPAANAAIEPKPAKKPRATRARPATP